MEWNNDRNLNTQTHAHISVDQSTQWVLSAFIVAATVVYSAATKTTKMEITLALNTTILMNKKFHRNTCLLSLWRRSSRYRSSGRDLPPSHILSLHHTAGKRYTCFLLPRTLWWGNSQKQYHMTIPRAIAINQLLNVDWLLAPLMNSHELPNSLNLLSKRKDLCHGDQDRSHSVHSFPKFHSSQY